jgi:hypothetical protein
MNRQNELRSFTNSHFEEEVGYVQKQNSKLLSKLKGDLSIKYIFSFNKISDNFTDKFQSAS